MSTWCYFQCLDHEPPLTAPDEFTQHIGDRHWDRAMFLIDQRPVEVDESYWAVAHELSPADRSDAYFNMNARRFLHEHETCRIGIIDEYGKTHEPVKGTPR